MAARRTDRVMRGVLRGVRRALAPRWLPYALAALLAVLLAGGGWTAVQVSDARQGTQRDQDVLAAARQSALNFLSLDYRHYNSDVQNVLSGATGTFKQQFASQTKDLTSLVTANRSVSVGQVVEAGVISSSADSARVLVVADSQVTNAQVPKPQTRNYRLQLDLTRSGGRWLTSDLAFVS